uniref:Uncharacterized protein n=1 Tax=Equus caballus TaxID=9796 RepID=A0A3Q2IEK8_HORSE
MELSDPLCIVALVVIMGLTWIIVSILLGGPGSGFPCIQQLFTSECGTLPCPTTEVTRAVAWACGLSNIPLYGCITIYPLTH